MLQYSKMGRETPCFTCEIPEIHPENELVWDTFRLIKSQIRVSAGGDFLGYDLSLVPTIIAAKGLPVWMVEDVLHALTAISDVAVRIRQEEREKHN